MQLIERNEAIMVELWTRRGIPLKSESFSQLPALPCYKFTLAAKHNSHNHVVSVSLRQLEIKYADSESAYWVQILFFFLLVM